MNDALVLRLAQPRDAAAIAAMSRDYIESGLGWKYDAARVRRSIDDRDTIVLAACERAALVGFAIMDFGDERAHLVLLAVQPARRRRGVGRSLLEWLLESARTAGIASIHLELRSANEAARRFYRALGFSETLLIPRYYGGREAAVRMVRVLRAPGPLPMAWQPPALGHK
jgi:ribosomal protein S18 acetylase RimI-like enzyme